jgi:hypothetical protein
MVAGGLFSTPLSVGGIGPGGGVPSGPEPASGLSNPCRIASAIVRARCRSGDIACWRNAAMLGGSISAMV